MHDACATYLGTLRPVVVSYTSHYLLLLVFDRMMILNEESDYRCETSEL